MGSPEELTALAAARNGDRKAFGVLVRLHQRRVWRVAVHMTASSADADDVTQETFLRALKALPSFDGRSELETWLFRIVVNLSLNVLRRGKRASASMDIHDPRLGHELGDQADPSAAVEARRLYARLAEALDELSLPLRTTMVLVALEGLPHKDAAEVLGCSEGTVAWRVHQARQILKERLGAVLDRNKTQEPKPGHEGEQP